MTPGEESSQLVPPSDADPSTERRRFLEDVALVTLALLLLVVPVWRSSVSEGPIRTENLGAAPVRIDINSAPWYEWTLLEGIGEARARAIVEHREANGPFRSLHDLRRIPRMPSDWVDRASPYLEVGARVEDPQRP